MQKIIDPHLHLFDLNKGDYLWLAPQNPPFWADKAKIAKSFSIADLVLPPQLSLAGLVHIEAGFNNEQPEQELSYLEKDPYRQAAYACRSIAYVDLLLDSSEFEKVVTTLKQHESLVGVRYIIDDNAEMISEHPNVLNNLQILAKQKLIFELQCDFVNQQLTGLINLFTKTLLFMPQALKLVINHAGFPPFDDKGSNAYQQWFENMSAFAALQTVYVKCSGFEMVTREFTINDLQRVVGDVLSLFGVKRVMLASNFPLCLLAYTYQEYWLIIIESIARLKKSDLQSALLHDNAYTFYGF